MSLWCSLSTCPSEGFYLSLGCSLQWTWGGGKGIKVMQHCHQWVLIPIYLHLCGTNPSVHSRTIKVNHRLVRRTKAACHNRLSNEALTGYQSQNKERATGLWKPQFIKGEAAQHGWIKYLQVRTSFQHQMEGWQRFREHLEGAASTRLLLNFSQTSSAREMVVWMVEYIKNYNLLLYVLLYYLLHNICCR